MKSNKLKLSLQEIAEVTGESLPLLHDAIKAAHLKTFVVGRRRFARPSAVEAWIGFLEKQSDAGTRSEEDTSELQSLMRISYAVFCLKKKKLSTMDHTTDTRLSQYHTNTSLNSHIKKN